jgi:hypothetical protein
MKPTSRRALGFFASHCVRNPSNAVLVTAIPVTCRVTDVHCNAPRLVSREPVHDGKPLGFAASPRGCWSQCSAAVAALCKGMPTRCYEPLPPNACQHGANRPGRSAKGAADDLG